MFKTNPYAVANDIAVLHDWENGKISTVEAMVSIEAANHSTFQDFEEFTRWANGLGWRQHPRQTVLEEDDL